jgi:hypothetical protein
MLYRLALGLGMLLVGLYVGREVSRTRPVRAMRHARAPRPTKRLSVPDQKVSIH